MKSYLRTLSDVNRTLLQAKHKEEDIQSTSQIFYYPSAEETNNSESNIKLLDIDEDMINLLEQGVSVMFKGDVDEKLVLCNEKQTFEVKEGETSNSLVLVPELLFDQDLKNCETRQICEKKIHGVFHSYLELRITYPRLSKLRTLLQNCAYKGPEFEEEIENKGYFKHELLELVQASEEEINSTLTDTMAYCLNGKWRNLDPEYESRILSHVVNVLVEQSWEEIHVRETIELLDNLAPEDVIAHLLTCYGSADVHDPNLVRFREDRVCRCFAEMLLRASEGKFRFSEFMMAWKQCLPEGMETNLNYLKGLALVDEENSHQKVIYLFPEHALPENVAERFRLLFKRKEKWTFDEIEPYVRRLATKTMKVNTMLTKYCRQSTCNGVRVYGARHGK